MKHDCDLSSHLKICNYFISKRQHHKAQTLYEICIKKFPLDFRSYFNYAQLCCLQKEHTKALELFYEALKRNETEVIIYSALSGLLIVLKEPEKASRYAFHGLSYDSENSSCWYNLNVSLRQLNRMDEAISLSWRHMTSHPSLRYGCKLQASNDRNSDSNNRNNVIERRKEKNENNDDHITSISHICSGYENEDYSNFIKDRLKSKYNPSFQFVFICVKYGTKYCADYVNNLYNALKLRTTDYYSNDVNKRNEGIGVNESNVDNENKSSDDHSDISVSKFRLICYTDDPTGLCDGVEIRLLPADVTDNNANNNNRNSNINTNFYCKNDSSDDKNRNETYKNSNNNDRENDALTIRRWKGWWIKAYLFYAVQYLIKPRKIKTYNKDKSIDEITNKRTEKISIPSEGSNDDDDDDPFTLPVWVCYLDLDTVLCNNIDFMYDLIEERYSDSNTSDDSINDTSHGNKKTDNNTNYENDKNDNNKNSDFNHYKRNEIRNMNSFYTLNASSFPSEGRPCGINSSIMIWPLHSYSPPHEVDAADADGGIDHNSDDNDSNGNAYCNHRDDNNGDDKLNSSNKYMNLYYFLLYNYDIITKYIYKFDHYLEMMLLHSSPSPLSLSRPPFYIQDNNFNYSSNNYNDNDNDDSSDDNGNDDNSDDKGDNATKRYSKNSIYQLSSLQHFPALTNYQQNCTPNNIIDKTRFDIKVHYLQDMAVCHKKIIDYSDLFLKLNSTLHDQTNISNPNDSSSSISKLSFDTNFEILKESKEEKFLDAILVDISIICFPLSPKPHEVPWMKELWEGCSACSK